MTERFSETVASRVIGLNPIYPQGFISVKGNYSLFLEAKEQQVEASGQPATGTSKQGSP